MLFVIDVGNSHTVVGLYDGERLWDQWRLKSDKDKTPDEIGIQFNMLFSMANVERNQISGIIISSVVPSLEAAWLHCCEKYFSKNLKHQPFVVNNQSVASIITIDTEIPSEVGADRLVNAVAAWAEYQSHLIIIDFGTAITFDCITESCVYLGGTILPGVAISLEALSSNAAKLPHIDISTKPNSIIGRNTIDAMKSGVLHGYGCMIDGLVDILAKQMCSQEEKINVVATGGMAGLIVPYSSKVHAVDQMLTLKGLRYIYKKMYDNE